MESLGEDHPCSDTSVTSSTGPQDCAVPENTIIHRLRDREMLRKRKEAAQEKESNQWILRQQNKRQRRGKTPRRGRGQRVEEPVPQPGEKKEPQPEPQEKAEAVLYKPAPLMQLPMLSSPDLFSGMQAEGQLEPGIQNLASEEEATPSEPEIPEALNTPLENVQEDNEYFPHVLF